MSPTIRKTRRVLTFGEREVAAITTTEETESPVDALIQKLEKALQEKGKKKLPKIRQDLMNGISAPAFARLSEEFPSLVVDELYGSGGIFPSEAAFLIKETIGATEEQICLAIFQRFAAPDLNLPENKVIRRQFVDVIADEVDKIWPKEEKK